MPRNNGIYSPPSGTQAVPQTPISSAAHNAWVADITADQNNPRPIIAGGTGAATAQGAIDALFGAPRTIPAGQTISVPGDQHHSGALKVFAPEGVGKINSIIVGTNMGASLSVGYWGGQGGYINLIGQTEWSQGLRFPIAGGVEVGGDFGIDGGILEFASTDPGTRIDYYTNTAGVGIETGAVSNWTWDGGGFRWRTGGSISGALLAELNANGFTIPAPTQSGHAATRAYVDGTALGVGQTWYDYGGARAVNTSYQNTTGRVIAVFAAVSPANGVTARLQVSADNATWVAVGYGAYGVDYATGLAIVPPWHYYRVSGTSTINEWSETR